MPSHEYLVRLGIESLSLNPDSVIRTTLRVLELEDRLRRDDGPGRQPA